MNAATARSSSTIANTRWRLAAGSEKPAQNSAGATVAPRPIPVSPEPISVSAWVGGSWMRKTAMPAARNPFPTSGRYCIARLSITHAERDGREDRARQLRQVQQPQVQRAVASRRAGPRSARSPTPRRRRRTAPATIPATGIVLVSIAADRQQRSLGPELVDDQRDDQRQPADQQAERPRISRNLWVSSSDAPKKAATEPAAARAIAFSGPRGALGSAGGASSNVNSESTKRRRPRSPRRPRTAAATRGARPGCRRSWGPARRRRRCTCS